MITTLDDFAADLDEGLFDLKYRSFWVSIVLELVNCLGPDTDENLGRFTRMLLEWSASENSHDDPIATIPHEIVRLRGPGFWRDDSVIGLKYRCVNALAASDTQASGDDTRFGQGAEALELQHGVVTAFQLMGVLLAEQGQIEAVTRVKARLGDLFTSLGA